MIDFELIKALRERFEAARAAVDVGVLRARLDELSEIMARPETFADSALMRKLGGESREISEILGHIKNLDSFFSFSSEAEKNGEVDALELISDETDNALASLDSLELYSLFRGKFDLNDCIIEIHAGAGGEDAQDWAEMLSEMYIKYAESHGFAVEILEATAGEGAGIKSEAMKIIGARAFGRLKNETGVHRLVRISPFDSNARRHTSFASVLVTPVVEENSEIKIRPEDLKIDTYRSSGAGGQHVNKTDSAVRITHLPTGTVVACQNERSQIQNREQAMKMLLSKLTALRQAELEAEKQNGRKEQKKIEWGSQIRSYVFAPYTQVKDLRTGAVNTNVNKVMAGDLDLFIIEALKNQSKL